MSGWDLPDGCSQKDIDDYFFGPDDDEDAEPVDETDEDEADKLNTRWDCANGWCEHPSPCSGLTPNEVSSVQG